MMTIIIVTITIRPVLVVTVRMTLLTIISSILIVMPVWIIITSIILLVMITNVTKGKQIAKEKHHLI